MKNGKYNTSFHQKVPGKLLLCARAIDRVTTPPPRCAHTTDNKDLTRPFSKMMTETNQKRTAVEFDLNTLEPVMDDNSINNTVTAADRMDHYIDMEVKGTGRRPTYKQLEAASKQQKSEPFPRIKMLDYQNQENEQAQLAFNDNGELFNNNMSTNVVNTNNTNKNAGSPHHRQRTPSPEEIVSRADLACRGNTCVLTVCVLTVCVCVFVLRRTIVR